MAGPFPVSGSIDPRGFPFLVMDLYRHQATGSLKVDGPSYQKDLYFRGGRILFGSSNDPRDQLGAILIESGRLTPEQLDEVNAKVGPGNPLAKVLADSGLVTQQELTDAARLKVEQILGDILQYREGSFEFEDGVLPKGAVDLKLHTDRLVLGAIRRITDRSFVLGHLSSLEVVLTPGSEPSAEVKAAAGELLAQIDGQRTLKDAIARTMLEEFDAAKMACALAFLGLVQRPASVASAIPAPVAEDSPFFVSEPAEAGLDLGATARVAMDDGPAAPAQEAPPAAPAPVVPSAPVTAPPPAPVPVPLAFGAPAPAQPPSPPASAAAAFEPPLPLLPPLAPPPRSSGLVPPSMPELGAEPAPEGRPLFPRIDPPSQSDLAAINAIISSPAPSAAPRRPPTLRRETPRFGPPSHASRPSAAGRGSSAWLWVVLVLAVTGGGAAGAWWYWIGPPGRRVATTPSPQVAPTLAPPTLATPVVEPSIAATSPEPTKGIAAGQGAPTPSPAATATPQLAPTPAPVGPAAADGRALLRAHRFSEAGRAFLAQARTLRNRQTIQVLVACSDETLEKTLQSVGSEQWFIIPVTFKGRACHRLCWGTYETPAAAESAQSRLPDYFRSGGALPRVVPLASILP